MGRKLLEFCMFLLLWGCAGSRATKLAPDSAVQIEQKEAGPSAEQQLTAFIRKHVQRVAPLAEALNRAFWRATAEGKPEAWAELTRLESQIRAIYESGRDRELLQHLQASGAVRSALLARQLEILRLAYEENRADAALQRRSVELGYEVARIFHDFHAVIAGRPIAEEQIYDMLRGEQDVHLRRAAWEAFYARGQAVADKLLELVRIRNRIARQLGYPDYYVMQLVLTEEDPSVLAAWLDRLEEASEQAFQSAKAEIDAALSRGYGLQAGELMPWHYDDPFMQELPAAGGPDPESLLARQDPVALVGRFFSGLGLDPGSVLERSDLSVRPGRKGVYCLDIDRAGDVRILASVRPGGAWTGTLLHEMGHAVYHTHIDPELPWLLRAPAHPAVSEAVAGLFERLAGQPRWIASMLSREGFDGQSEAFERARQRSMLLFVRWCLVMIHFERELYRDPDQDLTGLWWKLRQRFQGLSRPEGRAAADWAAVVHLSQAPVTYHHYLFGQMLASQWLFQLADQLGLESPDQIDWVGNRVAGRFLRERIFAPGASLRWDELVRRSAGGALDPACFIREYFPRSSPDRQPPGPSRAEAAQRSRHSTTIRLPKRSR
ncbi:MAG: M2 family metallopeptidase [Deltaproteobacteria bacterium]|nr:M2 family metallopeptidase [Deltaproteobacteria bacterium]